MGIGLRRGRDFTAQDDEVTPSVVIVNEAFVRRYFDGQEAVGKRISLNTPQGPWREIIGVAQDSKYRILSEDPQPFVYQPLMQNHESGMTLHVAQRAIRRAWPARFAVKFTRSKKISR